MPPSPERHVHSVTQLNREARMLLEQGLPPLWVEGEISNFSCPASGHWYFTLKDRDAQVRCAMFRGRNQLLRFRPKDGDHVVLRGRVSLYEPRGDYQLIGEQMEPAGEGLLKREYERLKARLDAEGLFDAARKRALPAFPRRIAVITSPTGAAVRDVLHILARRYPPARVLVLPVPVQGAAAAPAIVDALDEACGRGDCDVVILARGGGSIEDLWAFNDERVARAIFRSTLPVVTGIGHETDFTIADFVADMRAPTPSGAAQLVVPDRAALGLQLGSLRGRLALAMRRQAAHRTQALGNLAHRLAQADPRNRLLQRLQRLDELEQRLALASRREVATRMRALDALAARLARAHAGLQVQRLRASAAELARRLEGTVIARVAALSQRLALATRALDAVSPLATLARGYAIVTTAGGTVVTSAAQLAPGEEITARLGAGRVAAVVLATRPEPDTPSPR